VWRRTDVGGPGLQQRRLIIVIWIRHLSPWFQSAISVSLGADRIF
jgi:hypothetical protein